MDDREIGEWNPRRLEREREEFELRAEAEQQEEQA